MCGKSENHDGTAARGMLKVDMK